MTHTTSGPPVVSVNSKKQSETDRASLLKRICRIFNLIKTPLSLSATTNQCKFVGKIRPYSEFVKKCRKVLLIPRLLLAISAVKLFYIFRYHDDACVGFVCICGPIHGTIHARSLGTKTTAGRKSLVYGK